MKGVFKDHFSQVASQYRAFRPDYPRELFLWLASTVSRRDAGLDCGCGNGQASLALAEYFSQVYAIDPAAEQIRNATSHPRVTYRVAPSEATGLAARSVDLVIVAQALHWFDLDRFYPEVRRVTRVEGALAAFTYGLLTIDETLDRVLGQLYHDILRGYWPPERAHVDSAYRQLPFPFTEIAAPTFAIHHEWSFDQLLGYLSTWSGLREYRRRTGKDALAQIRPALDTGWGSPEQVRQVSWPLALRVGRVST